MLVFEKNPPILYNRILGIFWKSTNQTTFGTKINALQCSVESTTGMLLANPKQRDEAATIRSPKREKQKIFGSVFVHRKWKWKKVF